MRKQITADINSLAMHSSLIYDPMLIIGETKTTLVTLTNMTEMAENSNKHQKAIWSDGSLFKRLSLRKRISLLDMDNPIIFRSLQVKVGLSPPLPNSPGQSLLNPHSPTGFTYLAQST